MGLFKDIVGGAIKGVKTIVQNARIGQQAKAAGFIQPSQQVQQQAITQASVAKSNNVILIIVAFIGIVISIIALFKRK